MKLTILFALFALALACGPRRVVVVQEPGTPQPTVVDQYGDEVEETADVDEAPPPVVVETPPPSPGPTYVWIVGRHRWVGGRWVWVGGRWVVGRPNHVWVAGHWETRRRGRHVWVPGHWQR